MSVTPPPDATHRLATDAARHHDPRRHPDDGTRHPSGAAAGTKADAVPAGRPRRPPRLAGQAVVVALVPALVWLLAHPVAVVAAVATLVVAAAAARLARERRARRPAPDRSVAR